MRRTVPWLAIIMVALLVPSAAVQSQELPPGYAELHLVWQVESVEQRVNPIEPQPITEDCLFEDVGIEVGDLYEATIGYHEPIVPPDEHHTWPLGAEYALSIEVGDLTLDGTPVWFCTEGVCGYATHFVHAAKYNWPDGPVDHFEATVLVLDGFPGDWKWEPSFMYQLRDSSGTIIEIGEPLDLDPFHWDGNSVSIYWYPWDGSICSVGGSLVLDPTRLIEDLVGKVEGIGLPVGLTSSLIAKLDNAGRLLGDDNPQNDGAALSLLEAFINEVEAQAGKKLSVAEATSLVAASEEILALMEEEPEPEYTMIDLGILGTGPFGYSNADAINNRGQIVGDSDVSFDVWHLFLWEDGEMTDLGVPGPGAPDFVWPAAINDKGQVVGEFRTSEVVQSAFLWEDGQWTIIRAEGAHWSYAVDVNSRGQILGVENPQLGDLRLFLWEDGVISDLDLDLPLSGPFAPYVIPVDLSDRGEVVGYYYEYGPIPGEPPFMKSFVWDKGELEVIVAPGGEKTQAYEMNARGQVVGLYYVGSEYGNTQAFLWEDGVMSDLPGLGGPTVAAGINDKGQIVGAARAPDGETHAVLWQDGVLVDLGSHDGSHHGNRGCEARDINDHGQVVGFCWTDYGPRAFLWEK